VTTDATFKSKVFTTLSFLESMGMRIKPSVNSTAATLQIEQIDGEEMY